MGICSHLNDEECAAHAQRGDRAAFSELVARFQNRIYRFLVRLTRSPDDALELTQETFLHAYQALALDTRCPAEHLAVSHCPQPGV
jgi:RNA polymerase sigma-70 factor (ECF subfamily)